MSDSDATIVGTAGRDPEMRYTQGGTANCKFSVAVNRRWGQGEDKKEETSWFDVLCWGTLAENVASSVTKGMRVLVKGRLNQNTWETDDGQKRSKIELVADAVGPDLRWATAAVSKIEREGAPQRQAPAPQPEPESSAWGEEPF